MKIRSLRRAAVAVIAPALAAGMVVGAPVAQAASTTLNTPQVAAGAWFAAQPGEDGLFVSHYSDGTSNVPFTDYGLNLDLYTALDLLGRTDRAEAVYQAVLANAADYTDAYGTRYAGAVGKLAAAVQAHGDDARQVGSRDLIAEIEAMLVADGDEAGRAKDTPDSEYQSTNILNQGWVVRALANAGSAGTASAIDFLLEQQCDSGAFRENMSGTSCTTGAGSVDGTAFTIQSLIAAADAGVSGLQDDIDDAAAWLVATQSADGSFDDAGATNTNSTGLAAAALAGTGHAAQARRAATWVAERQVVAGPEKGAIALDDAALATADTSGISDLDRDSFVRAGVQAVLALAALPADVVLPVTRSSQFVQADKLATVGVTGLQPGEAFTGSVAGGGIARGTADSTGRAAVAIPAPTTSGTRSFSVVGANLGRHGATTVTVLTARRLPTSVRDTRIARKGRQQVIAKGLRPYEPFQIRYRSKQILTGKANSAGRVIAAFGVGGSSGRKTVYVYGYFTGRKGTAQFTVK